MIPGHQRSWRGSTTVIRSLTSPGNYRHILDETPSRTSETATSKLTWPLDIVLEREEYNCWVTPKRSEQCLSQTEQSQGGGKKPSWGRDRRNNAGKIQLVTVLGHCMDH